VDEKFRKLQRNYLLHTDDVEAAASYIRILEQRLGVLPAEKKKVQPTDETIPCLLCEKPIPKERQSEVVWVELQENVEATDPLSTTPTPPRVSMTNPWQGVSVSTSGNYGSQVIDMHSVYFYICDGCIIGNSHKMFHYGSRYDTGEGIQNARDYFESWLKKLKESPHHPSEDDYLQTIEPYFEDLK